MFIKPFNIFFFAIYVHVLVFRHILLSTWCPQVKSIAKITNTNQFSICIDEHVTDFPGARKTFVLHNSTDFSISEMNINYNGQENTQELYFTYGKHNKINFRINIVTSF